jgi:hypothetical protein
MTNIQVVSVPANQTVADLVQEYADAKITYVELGQAFTDR